MVMRALIWLAAGLASGSGAAPARAAEAEAGASGVGVAELVVVGSRGHPRLATETAAPVDVFSSAALEASGQNDLNKVLELAAPSFNYPRTSSGPSVAGARPATLRGLSPDEVLVLINGKRRHASSILNFNNGPFRGAVPVDYGMIPVTAIARVEVLRDGAAAQYGSDAIAGVIDIVLKQESHGGEASVQLGETERGQGRTLILTGQKGLAVGDGGFVTVSGEVRDRGDTNAAEIDPRFGRVTSTLGDPQTTDVDLVLNAELPLSHDRALYGFVTAGRRYAESSPLFRAPTVAPAFYPNGFLPRVNLDLGDVGADVGARGEAGGWAWDLSDTFGYSKSDYRVGTSVNTSLGSISPTSFYGGGARYAQDLVDLTLDRSFQVMAGAHLAAGLEYRWEAYKIVSGDPASYFLAGAQGFPGFHPPTPVDVSRHALSVFLDGELSPVKGLDLGLAGRYEDYSDFGSDTTGKASAFWRVREGLALRATASTGLRAPSLQQQYFSTVTSQLNAGLLQNVGTFAVSDPISIALGASPLRPEKSTSLSGGVVLTPGHGLMLTLDVYRIDIDDRIALSENLQGPAVTAILLAHGVTNAAVARFFTNASDTRSQGWEATAQWDTQVGPEARLGATFAYGSFDTDVRRLATNPVLPALPLLGAGSIDLVTDAQPRNKAVLDAMLTWRAWRLAAAVTVFGAYRTTNAAGTANITLEGQTALDLSATWRLRDRYDLQFGVLNATDAYPSRVPGEGTGRPYPELDPLGTNGREYYMRFTVAF
jgi:iron complex outermembrane receptor protein